MVSRRPAIPPRNLASTPISPATVPIGTPIKTPMKTPMKTPIKTPTRTPFRTTRQQAAAGKIAITPTIKTLTLLNNHLNNNNNINNSYEAANCDPNSIIDIEQQQQFNSRQQQQQQQLLQLQQQHQVVDDICKYYNIHDKKLGEGGFAKVRLATHLATNQLVAVKVLDKVKLGPELPRVYNEIECLKKLKHQNIARLYEVFETTTVIYLVLEYCPRGELFDYIVKNSRLTETESAQILYDLMKVLDYIHVNGFAHRDLKPENVLLDEKHHIKLIDFGLAANCSDENLAKNRNQAPIDQLNTCCGSVTYAAPEVISGESYSGKAVDVWSAGVMLYALLVGQLPFNDNSINKLYQKIQAGLKSIPQFLTNDAADLIKRMLTLDPKERITVREVLLHPWLRNRANRFARINRRLDFGNGILDEQIMRKCRQIFPHLSEAQLKEYISQDFNYYSTTYYILQAKCPPRSFGVKRTPDTQQMAQPVPVQLPTPTHYSSPTKRTRFLTISNTPKAPRTPTAYLHQLQQVVAPQTPPLPTARETATNHVEHLSKSTEKPRKTICNIPVDQNNYFIEQENGKKLAEFKLKPTPKKSIVKRILDSVTPKKKYKKIKS